MSFSDLYPERRGGKISPSVFQKSTGAGHPSALKVTCERSVVDLIEKAPMVRHMLGALKASGCPVNLTKHIQCEMCQEGRQVEHAGGFDDQLQQVFLCSNNCTNPGLVHGSLVRNLLYAFDSCVNKYDFSNPDHLACTEVRKANLVGCGYLTYMMRKDGVFGWRKLHQRCVKSTAVESLVRTRFLSEEIAVKSVDKVFDRCYADLEPFGRRAYSAADINRAFEEKFLFGYS